MERKFVFEVGEYYHIFNRGVEKRLIFQENNDFERFLNLLYLTNSDKPLVFRMIQGLPLDKDRGNTRASLIAYSLLPNHFHIVAREDASGGLSKFLGKLSTSYSMYFNTKNERSGPLLCHPFRARHIDSDEYFRWVMSYVHINPLDIYLPGWKERKVIDPVKAIDFLRSYRYSSYPDYFLGNRLESKILNKEALPIDITDLESFESMFEEFHSDLSDSEVW